MARNMPEAFREGNRRRMADACAGDRNSDRRVRLSAGFT